MSIPAPVAGPSKPRSFFPAPFRIPLDCSGPDSSRSSTPIHLATRFRSASVFSNRAEEELRKKRHESVQRLRSTWELINEKYGSVLPEEDDEIDLRRCKVVKDRGYLRRQERREFGEITDNEEESSVLGGPDVAEFDSDEDELGAWDDRSGLDLQIPDPESPPRRTQEDEDDLQAFLRAEAERRLVTADTQDDGDSSGASSDGERGRTTSSWGLDDGYEAMPWRMRRTRISVGLEDLFPEYDGMKDGSEDELLQQDSDAEEATRTVPVTHGHEVSPTLSPPKHRSQRSDGTATPTQAPLMLPPFSTLPALLSGGPSFQASRTPAACSRPTPPPSLRSLFTPPPIPRAGPSSVRVKRQNDMRPTLARSASTIPIQSKDKEKSRIVDERPMDVFSSDAHWPQLRYARNGGTCYYCKPCLAAEGLRAAKAAYCKGRARSRWCSFEATEECPALEAPDEAPAVVADDIEAIATDSEQRDDLEPATGASSLLAPAVQSEFFGTAKTDDSRYMKALAFIPRTTTPRYCKHCRKAGGERASSAAWCKGRGWAKNCLFLAAEAVQKPSDDHFAASPRSRRDELQEERGSIPDDAKQSENPVTPSSNHVHNRRESSEPVVVSSGGGRARRRRMIVTPARTSTEPSSMDEEAAGTLASATAEVQRDEVHPRSGLKKTMKRVIITPPVTSPEPAPLLAEATVTPTARTSRIDSTASDAAQTISLSQTSILSLRQIPLSPPRSSSILHSSPPPRPITTSVSAVFSRSTPSPSLSAAHRWGSPAVSSLPPSSPPRATSYQLPSMAMPTPSPSATGERGSSALSDNVPLQIPSRRSALRRPSNGSVTTPHVNKKARFSLVPRSPSSEPTSAFLHNDNDNDDEVLLDDDTSPVSVTRSSPLYPSSNSSSPFSRELSVRAADVGYNLGPEPTGRLSSGMLAALAPSLSTVNATLGSAVLKRVSPSYNLPMPPVSSGSSTSTRPRSSSPNKSTAGLMLPPPVPLKRLNTPRLMTPTEEIKPFNDLQPFPNITFITQSPALLRARSRSRSVSVAPTARQQSVPPVPNTTPRRKSRLERDLARVARVAGDEAGLEWGMDEEVGDDLGRMWREGSVVQYLE